MPPPCILLLGTLLGPAISVFALLLFVAGAGVVVPSAVTGLVRLLVGWLEKLKNRNRFGALIGFPLVGFEAL